MIAVQLADRLRAVVGAEQYLDGPEDCDLATSDIFEWPDRQAAAAVIRPRDTAEVSAVLALLAAAQIPVVPRGAGLSYTGGLAVHDKAVVVDLTRIDHVTVNPEDRVAVVGAGATWESVAAALKPHALRSLQASPISGAFSTVGGLASQSLPAGTDGILGLTVVLADGTILRTGAGASGLRSGPDLTGLFLGDCGAFGLKTEVVIRLGPVQPVAFATFEFDRAEALLECLLKCAREGVVTRAIALDRSKSEQAKDVDIGEAVATSAAMLRGSGSVGEAVKNAAKLMGFAASRKAPKPWSLHVTIESATSSGTAAQLERVREICRGSAVEAPDVLPRALHAKPYSARGLVGPNGERWVPLHGIFAPAQASAAMRSLQDHFETKAAAMSGHGISLSWLISSSGPYVLIEPMFYWHDRLDALHMKYLSPRNQARFADFPANPKAREFVRSLRQQTREIMDAHGAAHSQLGRFYTFDALDGDAGPMMDRVKSLFDPADLMNPGVLGFKASTRKGSSS